MAAPIAIGVVDALVSNTCRKPGRPDSYRDDSGAGYYAGKPLIKSYLSRVFGSINVL
jgi:hypothetical protein